MPLAKPALNWSNAAGRRHFLSALSGLKGTYARFTSTPGGDATWSPNSIGWPGLPDARAIADELTVRQVKLDLGGSVCGPTDPVGRLLFNIVAMVAEFESDLIRFRTREGMKVAEAKGHLRGKQPKLNDRQEGPSLALLDTGEYTTAEVADLFSVGRSTVYCAVERERARKVQRHRSRYRDVRVNAGVPSP